MTTELKPTACILCSINCGLEVKTEGRHITKIRGQRSHPASRGYLCEKPQSLDRYQNGKDRLTSPMRRRPDGTYEPVDWDTAIREVAEGLSRVKETHGGKSIFYYGGGAQGNHLGGSYARAVLAALDSRFSSNALAQEKTGEFWVDGQLFGRARCHTTPDLEHAEVAVFVGKNPWQSHGFPRARAVLKAISKDPNRALIVIDPRRSETAALADKHLRVRPGGDAWLLAALLACLVEAGGVDATFIAERTVGWDELRPILEAIDIAAYCERAGVSEADVRWVASRMGKAESVALFEDLGIQQSPHSTLSSYLEKLAYVLTGNFGNKGGMNIHTRFASLGGGGGGPSARSPVTDSRIIAGLVPCNVIPDEILTDHPDRFRAMIVESSNPVHSLADSQRMRAAMRALEFSVVIDVAMTETAREADYVLPAASQFEKWEATFFTLEFPNNVFHLRRPLFEPLEGTLPEPEIHVRLMRALGGFEGIDLDGLKEAAAMGLEAYAMKFMMTVGGDRRLMKLAPLVLYETMEACLPEGARAAAVVWALSQTTAMTYPDSVRRAGHTGDGPALGNALFQAIIDSPTGVVFTVDEYEDTWRRMATADKKIRVVVPDLMDELAGLAKGLDVPENDKFPFILSAGERRSTTANTLYRDPAWRGNVPEGGLRIHPDDAARLGLKDGGRVKVVTARGAAVSMVELNDGMQMGHVSLPNGQGVTYPDADGTPVVGVAPNELTASEDRDWLAGTPWHKHVRARLELV